MIRNFNTVNEIENLKNDNTLMGANLSANSATLSAQDSRITYLENLFTTNTCDYKQDGNINIDMHKGVYREIYWMIDTLSTLNVNLDCFDFDSRLQLHIRFKDMASPLYQKTLNINIGAFQYVELPMGTILATPAYVVYDKATKTTATSAQYSKTNLSNDRSWHIDIYYMMYFGTPRLVITVNNIVR